MLTLAASEDEALAGISDKDRDRVIALYPLPPQTGQNPKRAQTRPGDRTRKLKVIIGSWTTTVAPVPSQTPIYEGTEEFKKLARKYLGKDGKVVSGLGNDMVIKSHNGRKGG